MSLAFSGTAGQKVSLWVTGSTFANAAVYLIAPGQTKDTGTYLGPFGTASRFYDAVTLPSTGTYTLLIDPTGTDPGCASFQMFTGADLYGSITPGGAAVQACNTVPGQNMNLLFSGTAGQRVSLQVSGSSLASAAVYLDAPGQTGTAGTYLGPLSTSGAYYDTRTLSTTGTYTLFVSPNSTYTGCATFTLYDVPPDASSTITPGGAAVQACNTVPGQNMVLSFSGTAGQRVSLQVTGSTLSNATVYLDAPGQAGTAGIYLGPLSTSGAYYNTQTLSTPGTYTLFVSPNQATTGCATFTLYDVPPDASGTIAVGGAAVQTCNTVPGQNMSLAFSGTAGQSVTVQVTNSTVSSAGLYLDAPGQTGTAGVYLGPLTATSHTYPAQTLATSGTYTLYVNPNQEATGCVTLMLQ